MKRIALLLTIAALLVGCNNIPKQDGGSLKYSSRGAGGRTNLVEVKQGENPNTPTTHSSTYSKKREYTIPAKSVVMNPPMREDRPRLTVLTDVPTAVVEQPPVLSPTPTPSALDFQWGTIRLAADMRVSETETETHDTQLGASQESGFAKALALRERFAAARPILWVGLAVFVLVGGALAYFGWWTKAIIAWVLGGALVAVSVLLPQVNPLWLIGGAAVIMIVAAYIVLHAYNAGKADTNGNGVNDFVDKVKELTGTIKGATVTPPAK